MCTDEDQKDPEERLLFLDDVDLTGGTRPLMSPRLQLCVSGCTPLESTAIGQHCGRWQGLIDEYVHL